MPYYNKTGENTNFFSSFDFLLIISDTIISGPGTSVVKHHQGSHSFKISDPSVSQPLQNLLKGVHRPVKLVK